MELPILRNRELRVSLDEISKSLVMPLSPEDLVKLLNLANQKLLRVAHLADFGSYLAVVQQPMCHAINVRLFLCQSLVIDLVISDIKSRVSFPKRLSVLHLSLF